MTRSRSFEDCVDACGARAGCFAVDWEKNGGVCYQLHAGYSPPCKLFSAQAHLFLCCIKSVHGLTNAPQPPTTSISTPPSSWTATWPSVSNALLTIKGSLLRESHPFWASIPSHGCHDSSSGRELTIIPTQCRAQMACELQHQQSCPHPPPSVSLQLRRMCRRMRQRCQLRSRRDLGPER